MTVTVRKEASAAEIQHAACTKFAAHDRNFNMETSWTLRYPDGSAVDRLPEGDELFRLDKYRDQLCKDFIKIVLYLSEGTMFAVYYFFIVYSHLCRPMHCSVFIAFAAVYRPQSAILI